MCPWDWPEDLPPAADDPALNLRAQEVAEEGIYLRLQTSARRERLSFWMLLRVPEERLMLSCKADREAGSLPSPSRLLGARRTAGPLPWLA